MADRTLVHIVPSYFPAVRFGGPIVSVRNLVKASLEIGEWDSVKVITTNLDVAGYLDVRTDSILDGVEIKYVNVKCPYRIVSWIRTIGWNRSSDVVIHSWWNFYAMTAMIISFMKGKNILFYPRGMYSSYSFTSGNKKIKILFHYVLRPILSRVKWVVTSELEMREVCERMNTIQLRVRNIPNLVTHEDFENFEDSLLNRDVYRLGYIGRIHPKKGLEYTISSMKKCRKDGYNIKLILAGSGEKEYIKKLEYMVKNYSLEDDIMFLDWVEDKRDFFSRIDAMILTSLNENFANSVVESLLYGVPVLVSNNVGAQDLVVRDSIFGEVFDLESAEIKEAIVRQLNKPKISRLELSNCFKSIYNELLIIQSVQEFIKEPKQ